MGKLDELRRSSLGNIRESMGAKATNGAGGIPRELAGAPKGPPAHLQGIIRSSNAAEIPLSKIVRDPNQPREEFEPEALQRLAESLRTNGQLQPCLVRWVEDIERYMIIAGERRWRAAELAGLPTMKCVIHDAPVTASELLSLQIIENMLREDLRPIEQAKGFRSLMDANGWSGNQLAEALGIAQPTVVKALSLLRLPEVVQEQVEQGTIAPTVAYEISRAEDPEIQRDIAERVATEGLSRAETVEAVKRASKPKGRGGAKSKGKPSRLPAEMKHRGTSGCRVVVHTAARHTLADVLADVEEYAEKLRLQLMETSQEAA
jgi:ParB family chromosome partitioning protein